jgi:hypothetical protein
VPSPLAIRVRSRLRWGLVGLGVLAGLALLLAVSNDRGAPSSRISPGGSASEYWDIVARFDSNHSLFVRFLITNEGPGDRTAVATWYLVDPDGIMVPFRNGRRQSRWTLSPDGDRIEIGSSVLDQRGSVHSLEYSSGKRGIKVHLRFAPTGAVAWTDTGHESAVAIDLLGIGTPVVGTLWLRGMSEPLAVNGSISVTHTWMDAGEADLSIRRIAFSSTGEGDGIYVSDVMEPGGDRHRWLVVKRADETVFQTSNFQLEIASPARWRGGYPVPASLRITGAGIEGTIRGGPILVEVNPLEHIPQPFRFLLSFKVRPRRLWALASFDVKLRADPNLPMVSLHGSGITSVTYLNPLPKKTSGSRSESAGA